MTDDYPRTQADEPYVGPSEQDDSIRILALPWALAALVSVPVYAVSWYRYRLYDVETVQQTALQVPIYTLFTDLHPWPVYFESIVFWLTIGVAYLVGLLAIVTVFILGQTLLERVTNATDE